MTDSQNRLNQHGCEQCGAELSGPGIQNLCPRCLLQAGLAGPAPGHELTTVVSGAAVPARGLLQPGDLLGHYRIERPLGGGGMGTVFEAEDLDSGRRVALKVLSQALDAPPARERFFREGRLAASINHPNSVYVFGTEEVAGIPVIAMELVAGGTLEEHVRGQGPMPAPAAVDAILQIIAGLEAAQNIGILHRDVKPSNCFRDADGAVKIGDFGLSISTAIRTEPALTSDGGFLGTPAFCSPEQLRGEELNARSDLYSVGATLFYLLTGRTPFAARNVVALIAMILERPAPSPREVRPELPRGLAKVVRRCLERQPGERFKTYDELRRALTPYSSAAPVPATLGLRCLAGLLDLCLHGLAGLVLLFPEIGSPFKDPFWFFTLLSRDTLKAIALMAGCAFASLSYYSLLEGFWGATVGKALCRLRVVDAASRPPGLWRALGRAVIYLGLPAIPSWIVLVLHPKAYLSLSSGIQFLSGALVYIFWGALFITARRRNGFAALQDLATKTRVVSRAALRARPSPPVSAPLPPEVETRTVIGPYHVLETLEQAEEQQWFLAYDLRLLRRVWLRVAPPGTPPIAPRLRALARVGRLRWISGRRSPDENWDAFEAPSGNALLVLARKPQSWQQVRYWLADLAGELTLAIKDGDPPPHLALDRVWITSEGRAKLLDFPAPGLSPRLDLAPNEAATSPPVLETATPPKFLLAVARTALEGKSPLAPHSAPAMVTHLPVHATEFLRKLPEFAGPEAVARALQPLLQRAAAVTSVHRALLAVGCAAFPLFAALAMILGQGVFRQWNQSDPEIMELNTVLTIRGAMRHSRAGNQNLSPTDRQFALYVASHYRAMITNDATWSSPMVVALIKGEARQFAEQSLVDQPAPTAEEVVGAEQAVKTILLPAEGAVKLTLQPPFIFIVTLVIYVSLPAALAALFFRGGLALRIAGMTFVRSDGAPASRLRLFWRALATWMPFWLVMIALVMPQANSSTRWLATALVGALTLLSVVMPARGLADRLAGTWPIPR